MNLDWVYVKDSPYSVDETVHRLSEALKARQFGVLWQMDVPGTLQAKGMPFSTPYRILEVCNPKAANEVLSQNLQVGYFLPCKIAVYEEGEKTKVALPKPTSLIGWLGDPALHPVAARVEEALEDAVAEAVHP
ncbi:DUF302 domain-containing protein [Alicyclobacillus vulcanalis]|uniref:Uncharacterized conserved protein, DUF302 family n=1 Tax=Alicyclobacillus vulcanalis TaxID=252246 RepID=A0A1N7NNP2_9BACL|nr:DUF302 domain-containing protein [Alicyclobacillus vulcanalis]SIS99819.1 Uncharacterized conserved protein, DUF302 family [Alicyclobacillus vulcanalis]